MITGDAQDRSVLCVVNVLLLCRPKSQTDRGRTKYVSVQHMECATAQDMADKERGCVSLRLSPTNEEDHSSVTRPKLYSRTELNMNRCFGLQLFSAIGGRRQLVRGSYRSPTLSKPLPLPYPDFNMNMFNGDDLLQLESKQREK